MDGWLLALIIIVIVVMVLVLLWALVSTPSVSVQVARGNGQSTRNDMVLAHSNLSQQTSNFIQQAKCGYKGMKVTYEQMDRLATYIGKNLDPNGELDVYLREKNEIYKELVEKIVVNDENVTPDDHLFRHLEEVNAKITNILARNSIVSQFGVDGLKDADRLAKETERYMKEIHKYDIAVVSQMKFVADDEYTKASAAAFQAQLIIINH